MLQESDFFLPLKELAAGLRQKKWTSLELTQGYVARLEQYGPKLNAVVTRIVDTALTAAKKADQELKEGKDRGILHGIPYGVKDLLATNGVPTTWGAKPFQDQVFDYDATVVRRLNDAGAILIAKLAMVELAGGFGYDQADASFTGPGRTPWNRDYWSGGSSSGSGAAVAAALVPFAIGSETSGSIITPSTYCGVTGLRPTFGRISRHGAMPLCWSLDKLGPMARSAECAAMVLKAIHGKDPLDGSTIDRPLSVADMPIKRDYKIAILRGSLRGLQPAVKKNFEAALQVIQKFAKIDDNEVELPNLPFGPAINLIVDVEGASSFRSLLESGKAKELQNRKDQLGGYSGLFVPAVDYLHALRVRDQMKKAMHQIYEKYDALICPSLATVATPIDKPFSGAYPGFGSPSTLVIPAGNLVGQPAIAVPNGLGENGLPTGLSFTGKIWSEANLVDLARLYQQETKHHLQQPPLAKLI